MNPKDGKEKGKICSEKIFSFPGLLKELKMAVIHQKSKPSIILFLTKAGVKGKNRRAPVESTLTKHM